MRAAPRMLVVLAACTCDAPILREAEVVIASPSLVDFGEVPVGEVRTRAVELSVRGSGAANVLEVSVDGSTVFSVDPVDGAPVTAGAALVLDVAFLPTATGPVEAVLVVLNDSLSTAELRVTLRGVGIAAEEPDAGIVVGPGGGSVGNCDGRNGSPSCDFIQVPASADSDTVSVTCPSPYTLIGCGFLCDGGAQPGGTEMVDPTTCRAHCKESAKAEATAFCYRGEQSYVTRVVLEDVPRDTDGLCPGTHPQVLGCTSRCANASETNNPGGVTLANPGPGCRARCDYPGDVSPQLVVYCANYPRAYSQVVTSGPSGTEVTCPEHTTLVGGLGMCENGRAGGFIASDSRQYVGLCNGDLALDEVAAFCLAD